MITVQTDYQREVGADEILALTLECQKCSRFRTFRISANLEILQQKNFSAIQIKSGCSVCHTPIAVTIGWHSSDSGYTSLPVSTEGNHIEVLDNVGLNSPRKEI